MTLLSTSIVYLKGVGPERAAVLTKELQVETFGDLLMHYPYRYVDRSRFTLISELNDTQQYVQLKGKFSRMEEHGEGRKRRLSAIFSDESGSVDVIWFNGIKWAKETIQPGMTYVLFDKPGLFNNRYNFTHPELEPLSVYESSGKNGHQALYRTSDKMKHKGLDSRTIHRLINQILQQIKSHDVREILPEQLLQQYQLPGRFETMHMIHQPVSMDDYRKALRRLKFEELFLLQLQLVRLKLLRQKEEGLVFPKLADYFNRFYQQHLPFSLTEAQKRVIREIRKDTMSGYQMNRLLQGDVGSGKTIVSVLTMLMALDNGFQAALMAPTEILAQQHFKGISELLAPMGIQVAILTGSVKGKQRKLLLSDLAEGNIQILIGTHALIEDPVVFKNLGMVVIDEQHRFGVEQRARLRDKGILPPHILVMTATPIPRSLAMVFYGDLDYSVIDELPPGRKPITTVHKYDAQRLAVYGFLRDEIAKGRQVYIVYPLIEESEKSDLASLMEGFESICQAFPRPTYHVSVLHGKMKPEYKEEEMRRFVKGETHIMVATTVIEVGVNVPNASVMLIENAERFGLSQLHQLRGRVGRGAEQSFCILMTSYKLSKEGKKRIQTMCETNDGFKVSEADLELRGPGDVEGTRQSGDVLLKMANLATDKAILETARDAATGILATDPDLSLPGHAGLRRYLQIMQEKTGKDWSTVL
jgi:ATP-dependent DNA helicase RecG